MVERNRGPFVRPNLGAYGGLCRPALPRHLQDYLVVNITTKSKQVRHRDWSMTPLPALHAISVFLRRKTRETTGSARPVWLGGDRHPAFSRFLTPWTSATLHAARLPSSLLTNDSSVVSHGPWLAQRSTKSTSEATLRLGALLLIWIARHQVRARLRINRSSSTKGPSALAPS